MDAIDVLIARALTPQGQINTYAARAEQAVQQATQTLESINEIVENLSEINDLQDFTNTEIGKLTLSISNANNSDSIIQNLLIQYPNEEENLVVGTCVKYYTTTGQNTDGTMTQKAITNAINAASYNGGGGSSTPTIKSKILGLKINYTDSIMTPIDDLENNATVDFDSYSMYGGRKKCLVDNEGNIYAFYGEENYNEIPTNGYQVMVYQPKFYYKRTILASLPTNNGIVIKEEKILISPKYLLGFKLHPLFIDDDNNELEYVLLSAYEGSIESTNNDSYKDITYNNFLNKKLSSVAEAKPISGTKNNFTLLNALKLAQNRGTNWHILNIKALSALQMLQIIEFGTTNGQAALSEGICKITTGTSTSIYSAITGSTQYLGNASGQAQNTTFNYDGQIQTETENGKCACIYRGYENPWGNTWQFIGDILLLNNNNTHQLYICDNFLYNYNITSNYHKLSFNMNTSSGWISHFGYDSNYDWIFMPIATNENANSINPVGDYLFVPNSSITKPTSCIYGGPWAGGLYDGIFCYAFDWIALTGKYKNLNARLLYIPKLDDENYINNINKWTAFIGG